VIDVFIKAIIATKTMPEKSKAEKGHSKFHNFDTLLAA
jgi:hypothetical protein